MKRRIFSIGAILGVLLLVALLVSSHSVFALTPTISRTPTSRTPSKTPTKTKTPSRTPTRTLTPTTVAAGPDLVISSIVPANSNPTCANIQQNYVLVFNSGNLNAGTFQVSYSAGGVAAPAQTVNGLVAGQVITLSFPIASGAGMSVTATADSTNLVAESNETNNTKSATLPIPTQSPTCTPTRIPTPLTPTLTPTITTSPTGSACANPTPERLLVARVTTPTYLNTQVIQVTLHNGVSVTVSTVTTQNVFNAFTSTTKVGDVFSVTINLDPNTTTHLTVLGTVNAPGLCAPYDLSTEHASDGSNLIITQLPPGAPTWVPTATPTQTPPPVCNPVTATIASPFTFDGAGTFCWQATTIDSFINSFNMTTVNVNGMNYTNVFAATASLPAKIGGYWYIRAFSSVPWGHFEAK